MIVSRYVVVLAALVIVGGVAEILATPSAGAQSGGCAVSPAELLIDGEEQSALDAINALRAEARLPALTPGPALGQAAAHKASLMASSGVFAHDDPGRGWVQRIQDCGYRASSAVMENLAVGTETGRATVQMWRDSPGHHQIMLSASMRAVGIARVRVSGGAWYWAADFGAAIEGLTASAPPALATTAAPVSAPVSALQAGALATVDAGRGDCLNVRAAPGRTAPVSGCLADGSVVRVSAGPWSADGAQWWQLDGLGWASGEFLISGAAAGRAPQTTLPTALRLPSLTEDPCLPQSGAGVCDVLRLALWLGDADAWALWTGRPDVSIADAALAALRFRADQGSVPSAAVLRSLGR